ncbi:MAG TPA: hypothetical protein VGV06_14085 [Methylomirabilota bacterium]|nr:hypothetical protein [Methylomirabilota bacterium]
MMRSSRAGAAWLLGISLLTDLVGPGIAPAAETPVVNEVQDLLQISAEQRLRLVRGEVVSYSVSENSDRELAVGFAMILPAPMSEIADYLASGQLIAQDDTISDFGAVPDEAPTSALVGPRFSRSEREEAEGLLAAAPGTRFNLSLAEIDALRAVKGSADTSAKTTAADIASDAYRRLLHQRLQAYRQGGLATIAHYARTGGAVTDPAVDLRLAAADAERLARLGPELHEALLRYPAAQPPQMVNHFYWIKRRVQRRPHLSLLHRIVVASSGSIIHVERYYYAGHSFNATQILTGAFAHRDGTLVFSINRVSTDEVLGVGNQLKRTIGRTQLRDDMRARLDRLQAVLIRPRSTQSP